MSLYGRGGYSQWNAGYSPDDSYGRRRRTRADMTSYDVEADYDLERETSFHEPTYPMRAPVDLQPDYGGVGGGTARGRRDWAKHDHRGDAPAWDDLPPDYGDDGKGSAALDELEPDYDYEEPTPDHRSEKENLPQQDEVFERRQDDQDHNLSSESLNEASTQSTHVTLHPADVIDDDASSRDSRQTMDPDEVSVSSFDRVRTFARMRPDPRKRKPELKVEQVQRQKRNVSVKELHELFSKIYRCAV